MAKRRMRVFWMVVSIVMLLGMILFTIQPLITAFN